jgi:hypothetical protein
LATAAGADTSPAPVDVPCQVQLRPAVVPFSVYPAIAATALKTNKQTIFNCFILLLLLAFYCSC